MSIKVGQPWRSDPRDLSLRPYEGTREDLTALTRVRNETLRATSLPEDFSEMDEEGMAHFYSLGDFSLVGNAWLLLHGSAPVGAAVIYPRAIFGDRPPGNFDMYVAPTHWRHGLGSRLLAHLEQAASARGHQTLETTVAREDQQSVQFLRGRSFQVVGQSAHLARANMSKARLPRAEAPEGYALHSLASLGEPPEMYRETSNRLGSYDANYSLIRPEEMEAAIQGDNWDPGGILFLFDSDRRIVGVIRASIAGNRRGYMHEIRLEPGSRGRGLGMFMLSTALRYLAERGASRVELDTTGDSTSAHNLALKAGFSVTRHWLHFLKPLTQQSSQ
jgi:GNAT superfamily N-acetyltransferase